MAINIKNNHVGIIVIVIFSLASASLYSIKNIVFSSRLFTKPEKHAIINTVERYWKI